MSSLKNLMAACPNIEVVSIGSPSAIAPQRVGPRPIYAIARDIRKAWGAKVNYAAKALKAELKALFPSIYK